MQNHHRVMFCKTIWRQRNLRVAQHPPQGFLNYHQWLCWCQHILFLAWPFQRSIANIKTQTNRPSTNTTYSMPTTISNGNPTSQSANMFLSWLDWHISSSLFPQNFGHTNFIWNWECSAEILRFGPTRRVLSGQDIVMTSMIRSLQSPALASHFSHKPDLQGEPSCLASAWSITGDWPTLQGRMLHFFEPAERSWF